ncbi:MAG: NapC/NirT family cytochrome c [Bacteroidales bacterium]|nr:MAG: NapC/NirT family cytochrome c [Bacteroidales bacterium]
MKLPRSFYSWPTMIGAVVALFSLFMIVFLFIISTILDQGSSYLGIFIYMVLPVFLIVGLILIPIGMWRKVRRDRKRETVPEPKWPRVDFNDPKHRNAFVIFITGTILFLFLSAIGSYEAFHYTESVEFCGKLCHKVMKPEYTAYQNSPHARVACVECHVGPGADWYVRSKLSGLYQVYSVTFDKYPRPIPTPITNLRPARETCERCHWPEQFYARQHRLHRYYLMDEENTEWDISTQMKTGPSYSAFGLQEGIHWHINPDVKIEYIAEDELREYLPWVRYTNISTGKSTVYQDQDYPLDQAQIDSLEKRVMDCMDCHNRPSHDYQTPGFFINNALTAGIIPKLPRIKDLAMEIVNEIFKDSDTAMLFIEERIKDFYAENYSELSAESPDLINQAISGLQNEFMNNIFPEMQVRWDVYPNHIGHIEYNGCFRCHNDNHANEEGNVISKDCNLCHTINAQGKPDSLEVGTVFESLEFRHPVDIDEAWKEYLCVDCHMAL